MDGDNGRINNTATNCKKLTDKNRWPWPTLEQKFWRCFAIKVGETLS